MGALTARVRLARGTFVLDAELVVPPGITTIVGVSGAGKTTLLMTILGALAPDSGRIVLGERVLFDAAEGTSLPVRERRVGIVFQDALLFPHLDARSNVAFGITDGSAPEGWLERVGATPLSGRKPAGLSGGERQRVALARALAARPSALLLDEPFSALDPAGRSALGSLLATLQREAGVPFLHVTHDPAEALRIGETTIALDGGRVAACGPTREIVAGALGRIPALGADNWLRGTVLEDGPGEARVELGGAVVATRPLGRAAGETVVLALPADDVVIARGEIHGTSARNVLAGEVLELRETGGAVDVVVGTPVPIRAHLTPASATALALAPGTKVWLLVKANAFRLAG